MDGISICEITILYVKTSRFNKLHRFSKSASICLTWNSALISARVIRRVVADGFWSVRLDTSNKRPAFHSILLLPRGISKHRQFLVNWHCAWHSIFHAVPIIPIDPWHSRTGTFQFDTDPWSNECYRGIRIPLSS